MMAATIGKERPHSEFFVELENVTLAYGRGDRQVNALGLTNLRLKTGRLRCARRSVRLRQIHNSETGDRTAQRELRLRLYRRSGSRRRACPRRHGVSKSHYAAVADGARQRHAAVENRAAISGKLPQQTQDRVPRSGGSAVEGSRPRQFRRQASVAIVRRHAAAGVAVPRTGARTAAFDARRAVRGRSINSPAKSCGRSCRIYG